MREGTNKPVHTNCAGTNSIVYDIKLVLGEEYGKCVICKRWVKVKRNGGLSAHPELKSNKHA